MYHSSCNKLCSTWKNSKNHHPWDTCLCFASSWGCTLLQVLVRINLTLTVTFSPCWTYLVHCVLELKHISETVICFSIPKTARKLLTIYDQIRFLCKDIPGAGFYLLHTEYLPCSLNHLHLKWKWKTERNQNCWDHNLLYIYSVLCLQHCT